MQYHQNKGLENSEQMPAIPDKLYFTIGEVAKLCQVKTHVLRYWEQEFPQLSPVKRKGNRRYYQRKDVILIHRIKELLYDNGFTIEGAKMQIARGQQEQGSELIKVEAVLAATGDRAQTLQTIINDLEALVKELKG